VSGIAGAQTTQQDRRIEEEKREELKPTLTAGPAAPPKPTQKETAPPVPQPFEPIYFMSLIEKRIAYHYDAAKSIVILMGVDEERIDLESQVAYLQEKGLLSGRFREGFDPMAPLRKGPVAYMFLRALGIRGGIVLRFFGPSERYALKELAFQGIISPGHVNDIVSGVELVQIMSQAAAYKAQRLPKEKR
jgi:hypothetical protein